MESRLKEALLHVNLVDSGNHLEPNRTIMDDDDDMASVHVQVSRVWQGPNGGSWNAVSAGSAGTTLTKGDLRRGHKIQIDVTNQINDWLSLPRSSLGLAVRAFDNHRRRFSVPPAGTNDINSMPYLELYIDDGPRRRIKRTTGLDCKDNSKEKRCCRYPLTVDFEAFGWDWIIAPKKYEANYCMGECPYAFMQKYPNTHVIHLAAPPEYVGPCCTPRKVNSITLLYFNHNLNIVLRNIPAMVVEKCGCA